MRVSELIELLETAQAEHGDIPVYVDDGSGDYVTADAQVDDEALVVDGVEHTQHTAILINREGS